MTYFTSGEYVYFTKNKEELKSHHNVFILNQETKFTITSPLKILRKLLSLPKLFVKKSWTVDYW